MEECDAKVKDVFVSFFRDCDPKLIDTLYQNYGPYSPKTSIACCYMKCLVAICCWNEDAIEESYRYVKGTYKLLLKMQTEHQMYGTPIEKLSLRVLAAEALMLIAVMKMAVKRCIKHYLKAGMNLRSSWKVYNATQLRIVDLCERAGISSTKLDELITEEISEVDKVSPGSTTRQHSSRVGEVEDSFLSSFDLVEDIRSFFDSKDTCISAIDEIKQLKIISLFGYGLFHLILSLIPPTVLKIVNMFGFHGNRYLGISSLKTVSRSTTNYRSILASVALLWYNLSLRPTFLSNPRHIASGVRQGEEVIARGLGTEYQDTWLTLYFTGAIAKLQGNVEGALTKFQAAAVKAAHLRECKLMAYYEIGWCHLIMWNWTQASEIFLDLMAEARWSKGFYGFLAAISMGASGDSASACSRALLSELPSRIKKTVNVELDSYCSRKSDLLHGSRHLVYECKVSTLEMLYVWRCLSLSETQAHQLVDMVTNRPTDLAPSTLASSYLLLGLAWRTLELPLKAEQAFTVSDTIVQPDPKDNYITVCVLSELAELYHSMGQEVKSREMSVRAQSRYKGYDLENRLFNRVHNFNIN